jgi:hypothetical protein
MKAMIAAVAGGIVGALVWGAISCFTGYEVGYVAWGIGALVGFLSAAVGGEGFTNGLFCAVITILALMGGKVMAVKLSLSKTLELILKPA